MSEEVRKCPLVIVLFFIYTTFGLDRSFFKCLIVCSWFMELREVRLIVSARKEPIALSWTMQVPEKEAQHEHAT